MEHDDDDARHEHDEEPTQPRVRMSELLAAWIEQAEREERRWAARLWQRLNSTEGEK